MEDVEIRGFMTSKETSIELLTYVARLSKQPNSDYWGISPCRKRCGNVVHWKSEPVLPKQVLVKETSMVVFVELHNESLDARETCPKWITMSALILWKNTIKDWRTIGASPLYKHTLSAQLPLQHEPILEKRI